MKKKKYLNLSVPPVRKKRRVRVGRLVGGTIFFLVSHLLIVEGLANGMAAQQIVFWLGLTFAIIFIMTAFMG